MSSPEAMPLLATLRRAVETGRLAHAFLIVGSPEGRGGQLALALARLLYCTADQKPCGVCVPCRQVEERTHCDVYWVEPEKKSRIIPVGDPENRAKDPGIRYRLLEPLAQTAYAGGWKVGIILWAERMKEHAANALLKTLEEPPRNTLLILVTEEPQSLLPTIVSRCQRINMGEQERPPEGPWRAELEAWLADAAARGPLTAMVRAVRLRDLLDRLKDAISAQEIDEADLDESASAGADAAATESSPDATPAAEVAREFLEARVQLRLNKERAAILRAILLWQRDLLACKLGADPQALLYPQAQSILVAQARELEVGTLLRRIRAVEQARERFDHNLNPMQVLEAMVQEGV